MARHYYKTVNVDAQLLATNIERCKNQDNRIFELFKLFGKMTKWDVYDEYNTRIGSILDSSVGRSIKSLCDQGLIIKTDEYVISDMGQPNTLYQYNVNQNQHNSLTEALSRVNSIKIKVIYNQLEDGTKTIDANTMFNELNDKIVSLLNRTGYQEHPIN